MSEYILEAAGVGISFGGLRAVNDVSFVAKNRAVTSVIGPNGAGKSTLFNLLSGAIKPDSGSIKFKEVEITGWPANKICQAGLARSFQITKLFFDLTVTENLRLACQILESRGKSMPPLQYGVRVIDKVAELLERFQLYEKRHDLTGYLSHGEQRRLEVAMALASEPEMLLLDEPTQGMSHADTEDTKKIIRAISQDIGVLLVEHDIELVMDLSEWLIVMHQGQKLAEGPPDVVRADPAVRQAYLGEA